MKTFKTILLLICLPLLAVAQVAVKYNSQGQLVEPNNLKVPTGKSITVQSGGTIQVDLGGTAKIPEISAAAGSDPDFMVVVLPDTQYLMEEGGWASPGTVPPILTSWMNWVVANKTVENIKAVVGVGDITETGDTDRFTRAVAFYNIAKAAGIPVVPVVGNHDYNGQLPSTRNTGNYNAVFGPSFYSGQSWYGASSYPVGTNDNFYITFTNGAQTYVVIALEFWPRPGAITWAQGVIAANPNAYILLTTHAWLKIAGTRVLDGDAYSGTSYGLPGADYNGQEMYDALVKPYTNVRFVFNGHFINGVAGGNTAVNSDTSATTGAVTHQIFVDYQEDALASNYMMLLRFKPSQGKVVVSYYSPYTSQEDPAQPSFELPYQPAKFTNSIAAKYDVFAGRDAIIKRYLRVGSGSLPNLIWGDPNGNLLVGTDDYTGMSGGGQLKVARGLFVGSNNYQVIDGTGAINSTYLTTVPVNRGGTGATTASGARDALSLGAADSPTFTNLTLSNALTAKAVGVGADADAVTRTITLNTAAGYLRAIRSYSGGSLRWSMQMANATAETGANAGSDWQLLAYNDTGGLIDTPLTLPRVAGGTFTIARPTTVSLYRLTATQFADSSIVYPLRVRNTSAVGGGAGSGVGVLFSSNTDLDTGALTIVNDVPGTAQFRVMLYNGGLGEAMKLSFTGVYFPTQTLLSLGDNAGSGAFLYLNGAASNFKIITLRTAGVDRWYFGAENLAESGANAGSPFFVRALTDAGAVIDTPLTIARAAGGTITLARPVSMSSTLVVAGDTALQGHVSINNTKKLIVGNAVGVNDLVSLYKSSNLDISMWVAEAIDGTTQANLNFWGSTSAYPDGAPSTQIKFLRTLGGGGGDIIFYNRPGGAPIVESLRLTARSNVVVGSGALLTTATDGYFYLPGTAGTPTGVPTAYTGKAAVVVDTTNNKLYFYSNGAWRDAGP